MFHLRILSVGKTKETWLDQAIEEYCKRLQHVLTINFTWAKNDSQLITFASKEPVLIALDSQGQMQTSEEFSTFMMKEFESTGGRLAMVIGGAEGLPKKLKQGNRLISLSPMTFTHQLIRLILVEQLYRAFEIAKGSRYHK